jgi:hypothetical protein
MTTEEFVRREFVRRLTQMREAYPTQVIVGFLHPDGLQVLFPISPEILADPVLAPELLRVHQDAAEEGRRER